MLSPDSEVAARMQMIANHGQSALYYHDVVGVNSRLDTLQAAVLRIKLRRLKEYTKARQQAAATYDATLGDIDGLHVPVQDSKSTHVFHQYTLTLSRPGRTELMQYLESQGIPVKIYYPVPLHLQKAYNHQGYTVGAFPISEHLCEHVLSLPMHTHLQADQLEYIAGHVRRWFSNH
jgi:dTDP-4-amino-4,6-dideoxygalactose transaminase